MMRPKFVYLVEAQCGLVKIGFAERPLLRLANIRLHSPVLTRLIAVWPGGRDDERVLHERFSAHKSHAEWFRIEGSLRRFVCTVEGAGLEAVETWEQTSFLSDGERKQLACRNRSIAHRARHLAIGEFKERFGRFSDNLTPEDRSIFAGMVEIHRDRLAKAA